MTVDPREFEALEDDTGAFDIRVDGVPVWERIRFGVYQSLLEQDGMGQAHSTIEGGLGDYVKGLLNWLKNWVHRNPFLAKSADVMFVGHQRRKMLEDGLWWDIYCDPIHEACEFDSVHFEYPYPLDHLQPAKTEGLRYLDLIVHGGTLQQTLGLNQVSVSRTISERFVEIEREISTRFGASLDIEGRVRHSLQRRRSTLWMYERLLERVSPEVVVLVVGYGKETLIEACKRAGIPVVELQHGVIHRGHLAYHFPGDRNKEMFPDYLLTWGKYWVDCVDYPIDDEHCIPVGYPYLEREREKYSDNERRDQVLFISQGAIGPDLSKFAVEFGNCTDKKDVVYKLHPGEYDRWRSEYPWLAESNLRIIDDESVPLYRLFTESTVQVGVFSTAVIEGLDFDLETFLVDLPGVEALDYLYENDYATVVDSPEQLKEELDNSPQHSDRPKMGPLFAEDATANVVSAIRWILAEN